MEKVPPRATPYIVPRVTVVLPQQRLREGGNLEFAEGQGTMAAAPGDSKHNELMINEPPTDGISSVCFAPNESDLLLASSWDSVRQLRYEMDVVGQATQQRQAGLAATAKQSSLYGTTVVVRESSV